MKEQVIGKAAFKVDKTYIKMGKIYKKSLKQKNQDFPPHDHERTDDRRLWEEVLTGRTYTTRGEMKEHIRMQDVHQVPTCPITETM